MEPIITTAIISGIASIGKVVIKGGYNALKNHLIEKLGAESDLIDAVERYEKKPDSEARKAAIQEEVELSGVGNHPDMVKLAQDLIEQIKQQPGGQDIINQSQTNTVSNVNVGGNFEFKPTQEGKNN
jgi:hypothetical protein